MNFHKYIILLTIFSLIYLMYSCKCNSKKKIEKYTNNEPSYLLWKYPQMPKYTNLAVMPYSGFDYDVNLKYYYRNRASI